MFRRFTKQEHVTTFSQVKSSVQRGIKANLVKQYPWLESTGTIDQLMPKKESVMIAKWYAIASNPMQDRPL